MTTASPYCGRLKQPFAVELAAERYAYDARHRSCLGIFYKYYSAWNTHSTPRNLDLIHFASMNFDSKSSAKDSQPLSTNYGSNSHATGYNVYAQGPPPYTASSPTGVPNSVASPDQVQRCNFLLQHNERHSVKGTWHIDTALVIPESFLPPLSECNGLWNEMDRASIKRREKDGRKNQNSIYEPTLENPGVRPNLMLRSRIGRVQGEVDVMSGDGIPRMAVIVAESKEDSVKLQVNSGPNQPLRIFAASIESSDVHVSIPSTFQGLISMSINEGRVEISDGVKARLTMFSSANRSVRGYIGDPRGLDFGSDAAQGSTYPAFTAGTQDPFKNWTGSLVHLHSGEGSVHISFIEENKNKKSSKDSISDVFDAISTVLGML
ncbi:hypothetical protein FRC12_014405 [Ceratobasidium sp. 428]|nr:hypothetical protein FRC12_014405 [Ceratobasidium sp. 428]